jgi:type IV pilus assembly protein PilV
MKSPRRSEQGFSLVEVLVSVMILSIGLMAVASMQINAGRMDIRSMGMTEGGALAHGQMEELIGRPFEHADLDVSLEPHIGEPRDEYSLSWLVVDSTLPPPYSTLIPKVKTVTVLVEWDEDWNPGDPGLPLLPKSYQLTYLKPAGI